MQGTHTDMLCKKNIETLLGQGFSVTLLNSAVSTNTLLWQHALGGAMDGTVLIAKSQTGGRGRLGRSFCSEQGGLYLSLLLRPNIDAADACLITPVAALAVAQAIEKITGIKASIKWVNDVFCRGKKVCGILTEASINPLTAKVDFVVVGVGLNVYKPADGFPTELREIADALFEHNDQKQGFLDKLTAEIVRLITKYSANLKSESLLREYKSRCFVIGSDVNVCRGDESFAARAVDITKDYALVVQDGNGDRRALISGEVSVRPKGGKP